MVVSSLAGSRDRQSQNSRHSLSASRSIRSIGILCHGSWTFLVAGPIPFWKSRNKIPRLSPFLEQNLVFVSISSDGKPMHLLYFFSDMRK